MPGPLAAAGGGQAAGAAVAQVRAGRLVRRADSQMQPGPAGDAGGAQLSAEGDRAAEVVAGVDRLDQDGEPGGFRDRGGQDRGPACGGAGIVLPVRLAVGGEVTGQVPVVQAVGECHVPRLGTPPQPGMARGLGGRRGQERRRTSSPWTGTASRSITASATRTGAPAAAASARPYSALTMDMPGSGGRGQPDPRRGRVRAQLWHILAGLLDVHGGHLHPGRVQQPGRRLLQDTGRHGVIAGPVQQPPQLLGNPQPQRHRPVTRVVGQHDEIPAGHDAARGPPPGRTRCGQSSRGSSRRRQDSDSGPHPLVRAAGQRLPARWQIREQAAPERIQSTGTARIGEAEPGAHLHWARSMAYRRERPGSDGNGPTYV